MVYYEKVGDDKKRIEHSDDGTCQWELKDGDKLIYRYECDASDECDRKLPPKSKCWKWCGSKEEEEEHHNFEILEHKTFDEFPTFVKDCVNTFASLKDFSEMDTCFEKNQSDTYCHVCTYFKGKKPGNTCHKKGWRISGQTHCIFKHDDCTCRSKTNRYACSRKLFQVCSRANFLSKSLDILGLLFDTHCS